MEEIEQRFGSNKAALSDYLQRRKAAGLPDHRRAGIQRAEQRRPAAPAPVAEARKPGAGATSAKPPAPPATTKPRALTAGEQAAARQKARGDAVMASPHAKGRATTAAGLLGGAPNLSAEEIIAALATLPTDAETMASIRRQKADAVWDKAHGVATPAAAAQRAAPLSKSDAVWDRAYGVAATEAPKATRSSQPPKGDDVWGRIYGSNAA